MGIIGETETHQLKRAIVFGTKFTGANKAIESQVGVSYTEGQGWDQTTGSTFVGSWSMIAPPLPPEVDTAGAVRVGCEAICAELGDELVCLGQRDVRWSKYAQDMKPGEVVLFNAFGSRLTLAQLGVQLMCSGGSFLYFDAEDKHVTLSGFPTGPGQPAPRLVMTSTTIEGTSPSGGTSFVVSDKGLTVNGSAVILSAGKVLLGLGASQATAVVTLADLNLLVVALVAYINAHVHTSAAPSSLTSPPVPPLAGLVATASSTVFASP